MIRCPNCGYENEAYGEFCRSCGSRNNMFIMMMKMMNIGVILTMDLMANFFS